MASVFKKKKVELEFLTDVDVFLMVEKGIKGHAIHRYTKTNNKHMKNYDEDEENRHIFKI